MSEREFNLTALPKKEKQRLAEAGIEADFTKREGTFIQEDLEVVHCKVEQEGLELLSTQEALQKHDWLKDYLWQCMSPDKDEYTKAVKEGPFNGYFIRALPGVKNLKPIQAALLIATSGFVQNVHNIIIVEEGAELHIITGCLTTPHISKGVHLGVTEVYIKKGGKLHFTMIHRWGKDVIVRPRTAVKVEEDGQFISNYITLGEVKSVQMFPVVRLKGKRAVAQLQSVLVAPPGSQLDVGGEVICGAPQARAEIISRAMTTGGQIISRGRLVGEVGGVKGHLECKGLILKNGFIHAIPELVAKTDAVELSHEAAVGKIAQEEIEYLMARGLDEEEATSVIVRGFLEADIEGLPAALQKKLDEVIEETSKDLL
ncbi:MAG: SufD family Fe-S cluster assembly protein [Candidatus Desulfofervidaceae bacterium]|nr:SufD family Fe-S cluster assembly protein [Candidatus Desulfofervidaceae bacterium]